jgi:sporulation protein YlmC with PRC-barrel domain
MPRLLQAALLSVTLGASSLALAQTTPPSDKPPSNMTPSDKAPSIKTTPPSATPGASATEPQWHRPQAGELRASKLIGLTVRNAAGESIGDINEVVLGKDGRVAAVVIGVGGFLGIGEREVAVRFDALQLARGTDQRTTATLNASKEALKSAPQWKWSAENGR